MKRWLPAIAVTAFLVYVAAAVFRPIPSAGGFDVNGFGRLPVSLNGRVQPVDSAARLALLQIRGTVTVPEDGRGAWHVWGRTAGLSATGWLLEILARPDAADTRKVFPIAEPAVRAAAVALAGLAPPDGAPVGLVHRARLLQQQGTRGGTTQAGGGRNSRRSANRRCAQHRRGTSPWAAATRRGPRRGRGVADGRGRPVSP